MQSWELLQEQVAGKHGVSGGTHAGKSDSPRIMQHIGNFAMTMEFPENAGYWHMMK
jgi:hypothetical protein